ncbi:NAD(P)-dependent oxidoreductase [Sphaerotilaceae bacterium SBD11-9]
MKIALIGGTGFVGSAVLDELLQRGHQVTALARNPAKFKARERLAVVPADALDSKQVAQAVEGHDAVISAYNPGWSEPRIGELFIDGTRAIFDGVKRGGVKRLLVVGGAGSLYVAPGVQLVDTPQFPAQWKAGALAARQALDMIRTETTLDWTFVSPAVGLAPGERTGKFRLGGDEVLMAGDQPAGLSVADLAVAIVDEIEAPHHLKKRFTAAY